MKIRNALLLLLLWSISIVVATFTSQAFQTKTSDDDVFTGIAVDSKNRAYAIGALGSYGMYTNNGDNQIIIYILDSNNITNVLNNTSLGTDQIELATDLVLREMDETTIMYVSGLTGGSLFGPFFGSGLSEYETNAIVFAMDDELSMLWNFQLTNSSDSEFYSIAIDPSQEYLYLIGDITVNASYSFYGIPSGANRRGNVIMKMKTVDGSVIWAQFVPSGGYAYLTVDHIGSIYFVGSAHAIKFGKLNSNGFLEWNNSLSSFDSDYAWDITVDINGTSIIAGNTLGNFSRDGSPLNNSIPGENVDERLLLISVRTDGHLNWVSTVTPILGRIEATSVVYHPPSDSIYVGGQFQGNILPNMSTNGSLFFDVCVFIYDKDGYVKDSTVLSSPTGETTFGMAVTEKGVVYVTGDTDGVLDTDFPNYDAFVAVFVPDDSTGSDKNGQSAVIVIAVVCTVVPVSALAAVLIVAVKKRKQTQLVDTVKTPKSLVITKDTELEQTKPSQKVENTSDGTSQIPNKSKFDTHWELDFTELQLEREIGRGNFGVVYKGLWRNSECVIKQVQLQTADQQDAVREFLKEAEAVKRIKNHKNVCAIYGVCTNPTQPICIVMQYCNVGSLSDVLRKKQIEINTKNILKIAKDICSGMSHIHKENILHLDLACRNLLVAFEGSDSFSVKVTDFGLAKVTETGKFYGTQKSVFAVRWSSPEVIAHLKFTRAADVWAFGVVLWEIFQQEEPYPNLDNLEVIDFVVHQKNILPIPTKNNCLSEFYDVMRTCWTYDPLQRPSFDDLYELFGVMEEMFGTRKDNENSVMIPVMPGVQPYAQVEDLLDRIQ